MGDPRRFTVFAEDIAQRWPDRSLRIADVAGGHGHLNAALHQLGYRSTITFDKRKGRGGRPHYQYRFFDLNVAPVFDLVVAMHPDAATDVSMAWAIQHEVPFAVVPCCIRPTVWTLWGPHRYPQWCDHLRARAEGEGYAVDESVLPIRGANRMLVGCPS
jgi:hypothetical protein